MTEKERYETIIDVLTEKVKAQGEKIELQDWQISSLREQLEAAEFKINEMSKKETKAK